jgi:pimeloyl-ACP methyl ester carboxylesterase
MPWIGSRIPDAKAIMLDARHFVHLENPVGFNAAVRSFLDGVG